MGKASVGLVGGYWPENVFRYVAVPRWNLYEALAERPARQRGDEPALVSGESVTTYRQLYEDSERLGGGVQNLLEAGGRVGIYVDSPTRLLTAFLAALGSGYDAHMLNPGATDFQIRRALSSFKADLILCDEMTGSRAQAVAEGTSIAAYDELVSADAEKKRVRLDPQSASIALPGIGGNLIYHSHHSMVAGALSWSTFSSIEAGQAVLCARPLYAWEGLYVAMAALFKGGLCLLGDIDDGSLAANVQRYRPFYATVDTEGLEKAIADRGLARAVGEAVEGVFVHLDGPFSPRWRQRARNRLRAEVLTAYGSPTLGAVIASHPSWYEDSAMGIPVTNVDLWPLEPTTKEPLDVSWEAIEYAEIGVKSPMLAPSVLHDREWLPTGLTATMDANGFYYVLEQPSQWLKHLGLAIPLLDEALLGGARQDPGAVPAGPLRLYRPPTADLRGEAQPVLRERALRDIARLRFGFPTAKYADYETHLNCPERTMGVLMGDGSAAYPDVVVVQGAENQAKIVAQVESAETVSRDVARYEWLPYAELAPLYLYVPVGSGDEAVALCRGLKIRVAGIRTWQYLRGRDEIEINDHYNV